VVGLRVFLIIGVAACVSSAVSGDAASASPSVPGRHGQEAQRQDSAAEPVVLSLGSQPRMPLRLEVTPETSQQMVLDLNQRVSALGQPTVASRTHMVANEQVNAVNPDDGSFYASYVFKDVSASGPGAASIRTLLSSLVGQTNMLLVSPRNQVLSSTPPMLSTSNPTLAALFDQLSSQTQKGSQPFPNVAVGIGARWRTTSTLNLFGVTFQEMTTSVLRARHYKTVMIELQTTLHVGSQQLQLPGIPPDAHINVRLAGGGSGSETFDLTRALPSAVTSSMSTRIAERIEIGKTIRSFNAVQSFTTRGRATDNGLES
jgi:hypothetical protein